MTHTQRGKNDVFFGEKLEMTGLDEGMSGTERDLMYL